MNSKPLAADRLHAVHTSYIVDFSLSNNIILIMGDSGTGKSVVFLLTDELRKYIAYDSQNQYIILGRNPRNLMITAENLFELSTDFIDGVTTFTLIKYL